MFASARKTALAAAAATSLLTMVGASQAATFNPTNSIVPDGTYDILAGPYAFGVFFEAADAATVYTFNFFNSSATTATIGVTMGTVLQAFSGFAGGLTAAWGNGETFSVGEGTTTTFQIDTVLAPSAADTLTLTFGDPHGLGNPGLQVNVAAVSAVPLPAGGLLLLGALGAIAALRRRKLAAI